MPDMNGYGLNVYKFSVDKYVSELYTDEQFKFEVSEDNA